MRELADKPTAMVSAEAYLVQRSLSLLLLQWATC